MTSSSAPVAPTVRGALAPGDLLPFLNDLAVGFQEGSLADVITPTLSLFFQEWFKIVPTPDLMGTEWRKYLGAVSLLVKNKAIAALLPSLPIWVAPGVTASKIEWQSLLGPLTRLSVFSREFVSLRGAHHLTVLTDQPQIEKTYFSNPTERRTADIDANKANLRNSLEGLQSMLFDIYNSIVRASPESREGVLDFITLIANLNDKRSGMRVQYTTVSSDGFMINLQSILLKLFEPVMDVQFSKVSNLSRLLCTDNKNQIDKVDPEYYLHSKRIDIAEETKIRASKEEVDEYYGSAMDVDAKPNFISDIFFLLNSIHRLGLVKTIGTRKDMEKGLQELEDDLKNLEGRRAEWSSVCNVRQAVLNIAEPCYTCSRRGCGQETEGELPGNAFPLIT